MAVPLSSNESEVINRTVDLPLDLDLDFDQDWEDTFEVDRCAKWIQEKNLINVCLQFPDALLKFGPKVAKLLEQKVDKR